MKLSLLARMVSRYKGNLRYWKLIFHYRYIDTDLRYFNVTLQFTVCPPNKIYPYENV